MLIGYARVTTDDQDLTLQRAALEKVGCRRLHEEKVSGAGLRSLNEPWADTTSAAAGGWCSDTGRPWGKLARTGDGGT